MTRPARGAGVAAIVAALALSGGPAPGAAQAPLFGADTAIAVTLRVDLGTLRSERDTARAAWLDATLAYAGPGGPVALPLKVRTRGMFRLLHCDFPPLRLRFDRAARGTPFAELRRPKLVTHCRDTDEYEQYVLEEYAIYRALNLLTPLSLSVGLLRIRYEDAAGAVRPVTRYAFVSEEPEQLARRLGVTLLTQPGARLARLSRPNVALLGVFEYFVANIDWSLQARHNVALLTVRDTTLAVPYDFDWSGVIAAPYARPTPQVHVRSVRERRYLGYCQSPLDFETVLARFEALRDTIAALYRRVPGLTPGNVERTIRYYDEFYRTIADRPRFFRDVVERDCVT